MNVQGDPKAIEIYQGLLDDISASYDSGDFAAYSTYINVPHSAKTVEKNYEIETGHDLRSIFDTMRAHSKALGITNYIRVCVSAEFKSEIEIFGTHITYVIRGGEKVQEPYPVLSHVVFDGSYWRVRSSENAVEDNNLVGMVLRHGLRSHFTGQSKTADQMEKKND
jgi:hypothetical protein